MDDTIDPEELERMRKQGELRIELIARSIAPYTQLADDRVVAELPSDAFASLISRLIFAYALESVQDDDGKVDEAVLDEHLRHILEATVQDGPMHAHIANMAVRFGYALALRDQREQKV